MLELTKFNNIYFPSPDYKRKISKGIINEDEYAQKKEKEFLSIYNALLEKYQIKIKQDKSETFMDKWFSEPVRQEIDFLASEINSIKKQRC